MFLKVLQIGALKNKLENLKLREKKKQSKFKFMALVNKRKTTHA